MRDQSHGTDTCGIINHKFDIFREQCTITSIKSVDDGVVSDQLSTNHNHNLLLFLVLILLFLVDSPVFNSMILSTFS